MFDRGLIFALAACGLLAGTSAAESNQPAAGVLLSRSTGNHLFVPVRINRKPAWFAVDTGAALTIVDRRKAKLLGLSGPVGSVRLPNRIEVNDQVVPVANVRQLDVGQNNLGSGPVALIDLRDFRARLRGSGTAVPMDGIIGLDILERYHAVIDCHLQRIYFQLGNSTFPDIAQLARVEHLKSVPMRITHAGALEVQGRLGEHRYSFVVDTGGFATLIPIKIAAQNGIAVIATTVNAKGIHSKENPVGLALSPAFQVGDYNLGPMLVGVTGLPQGPEDLQLPFGGLIGADFLFERHAIIDVGKQKFYFR